MKPWFTNDYYRGRIVRKLELKQKLTKEKATTIVDRLCEDVANKIKQMEKNGYFKKHNEDLQAVLDSIKSAKLIGCPDGNIYNIFLTYIKKTGNIEISKTISLTDKQFYNEPLAFCIKHLTCFCFKKKIKITPEQWDENFIPKIQSVLKAETDAVESTCDTITAKFIHYIRNKNVFDWEDMSTRKNHKMCMFFDIPHGWVMFSNDFVDDFFIKDKITRDYKKTRSDWNSHLHREEDTYLIEKSKTGRIITGQDIFKRFWIFDPEKIEVSKDKIKKKEKSEENKSATVTERYGNKKLDIKPVED